MEKMDNHNHTEPENSKENHNAHNGNDHDKHAGHSPAMFQGKFWFSLIGA